MKSNVKNSHLVGWTSVADDHICLMKTLPSREISFEVCIVKSNKNLFNSQCEWFHTTIFPLDYTEADLDSIFTGFNDYHSFRDFLAEQDTHEQYIFADDGSFKGVSVLDTDILSTIAMYIAEHSFVPRIVKKDWALNRIYELSGYQFAEV